MSGMSARRQAVLLAGFLAAGLAFLALALLVPELALASEGGKAFSLKEELFKLVNTLIVIAILYKLTARPLRNFMAERREGIRRALAEAQQARQEAEIELEEQRSKVAELEVELERVRDEGHKERQVLQVQLQTEHESQATRLMAQAKNTIDLDLARARAELQNEAARLAIELAEQTLVKNLGPEDQKRIAAEFVGGLGAGKRESP